MLTEAPSSGKGGLDLNLDELRLSQDFESGVGVKKALITVPVRKPDRQWFVRTHPDVAYRFETALLQDTEDRELYLVSPALRSDLPGEVIPVCLYLTINRQKVVFFWPVRLPREDGRSCEWHESARIAAEMATRKWCRVVASMQLGAYEVFEAQAQLSEPEWPNMDLKALLELAFKNRFIDSPDHVVLRKLRGEL